MESFNDERALVANIVSILEYVADKPGMFFFPVDGEGFLNWRSGFNCGCALLGLSNGDHRPGSVYWQVMTEQGWEGSSFGPVPDMEAWGLDDAEIVKALITLEVATWKRVYGYSLKEP